MRYSKDHKSETRARIVKNASVLLREKGANGIGVAELMKEAGLTHGGFYAHFDTRDALIGEAFAHAMDQTTRRWRKRAEQAPEGRKLASVVNGYLTPEHRDDIGNGCALPALGAEVLRANPKTRKAAAIKLEEMIEMISDQMPGAGPKAARRDAISTLATMLGALMLARMAGTGVFSSEILEAGRQAALAVEAAPKPARRRVASRRVS
ncbi:MAG: TetR/AcrR family transcriptional regulator [Rhizobiales bacterium]|nr:TetR/AcrR family transcriptional regulator [Hyphomicrobiales bacterium]